MVSIIKKTNKQVKSRIEIELKELWISWASSQVERNDVTGKWDIWINYEFVFDGINSGGSVTVWRCSILSSSIDSSSTELLVSSFSSLILDPVNVCCLKSKKYAKRVDRFKERFSS